MAVDLWGYNFFGGCQCESNPELENFIHSLTSRVKLETHIIGQNFNENISDYSIITVLFLDVYMKVADNEVYH